VVERRRFVRRVLPRTMVRIVGASSGFAASGATGPAAPVVSWATEKLLHWTIGHFSDVYREGIGTLFDRELGGRDKLNYDGVSQFWTWIERDLARVLSGRQLTFRHVPSFWEYIGMSQKEKQKFGIPITLTGLFSPYGPLTPAHPMSRPGYSIQGWENMEGLETEDTEEYDVQDAVIYGDRVLRLARPDKQVYYGGLYDAEFGISNVALPLFINQTQIKGKHKGDLHELWREEMSIGVWARIHGNLIAMENFYSVIQQTPDEYKHLPSFGIEVVKLERWERPQGFTHVSASVAWERSHRDKMLAHYFNAQDATEFKRAEQLLQQAREINVRVLQFDYDNEKYLSGRWKRDLPKYNQMLDYLLSK